MNIPQRRYCHIVFGFLNLPKTIKPQKMKTFRLRKVFLLFFLTLISFGCRTESTNEENNENEPQLITAYKTQIVTESLDGVKSGEFYKATFQGKEIECISIEDNKIAFAIPLDANLGVGNLEFTSINKKLLIDVKEVVLDSTPENIINTQWASFDNYTSSLEANDETELLKANIKNIKTVFENSSEAEKNIMAIFYTANKSLYNDVLMNLPAKSTFGGVDEHFIANENFLKFKTSMYYLAVCGAILWVGPDPMIRLAAVAGILICIDKAKKHGIAFMNGRMVILDSFVQDKSTIDFTSGNTKILNYNHNRRSVIQNDTNSSFANFIGFFSNFSNFDKHLEKINSTISWLNENIPFCNFSQVSKVFIPTSVNHTNTLVNEAYFSRTQFSVGDSKVEIENVSLNSDGKINVKLKLKDNNATEPVTTTLIAKYADDYNNISKSFNIKVNPANLLQGNWKLTQIDGEDVPAEVWEIDTSTGCPGQKEDYYYSGTANITDSTMKINISEKYRYYRYDAQCNVVEYNEPTGWQTIMANHDNKIISNTLKLTNGVGVNDENYTWNFSDGEVKIIDQNTISVTYSYYYGELIEMKYTFIRQ